MGQDTTTHTTQSTTSALVILAEIGEIINADVPLDTILSRFVVALARLVPCDAVTAALTDAVHETFEIRAAVDGRGNPLAGRVGRVVRLDELPTVQTMMRDRTLVYLPDASQSPLWRSTATDEGRARAFLGAPLIMEEKIIGLLFIDFSSTDPLTEELRYAVLAFARYAAAAIHNSRQREKLSRSEERYRVAASLTTEAIYELMAANENVDWSGDIDGLLQYKTGTFPHTSSAWLNAIHPNDRKRVENARRAAFEEGTHFEEEYRMRRADGTYCYVLDRAMRFGNESAPRLLGAISDLTNTYELTDALVESEVRYRTLFARSLDAIFVTDSDGVLLDFNPVAETLAARDYAQLVATPFLQLVSPQNVADFSHALKTLQERGEVTNFETRLARPGDDVIEVEIWGAALGGGLFQFVARDVSVRKQSQLLAAQRVAELTALSEVTRATTAGGDVIEILNRVLPGAMGALEMPLGCIYLRDSNTTVLRRVAQSGYPDGSTVMPVTLPIEAAETGRITPFSSLVRIVDHPLTPGGPRISLQVALSSTINVTGLVIFSDVQPRTFLSTDIFLMDIIGRQLGIGVDNVRLLDNLEQLVQERTVALFTTETRYRSLIEQVPGVVYTADTVFSGVSFISSGTDALFGLGPPEFIRFEDALLNSVKPEDLAWVGEQANRSNDNGTDFDAQYRIVNVRTRRDRWVHHHARLIIAGSGDTFWLGLITDVTNLKELDELKSQFVATVSHELRTPLSAIKLRAGTLSAYYDRLTDFQRLDMIQRISYQSDILADLIEDVLRLAKLDGGNIDRQIEEVDLSNIGADVIEELRPTAETAGLTLDVQWTAQRAIIRADTTDMTRIWRNLISNAIKYTTESGTVEVYTGSISLDENCQVVKSSLPQLSLAIPDKIETGDWLVGVVIDTGKGISEYDQVHIFTRFFRGEAALTSIPGTGLGLSLVKELLDDYGGHIALHSTSGEGSTFAFWLPAAKSLEAH